MNSNFLERAGLCPFIKEQVENTETQGSLVRISHVHKDVYLGINEIGEEISLKLVGSVLKKYAESKKLPVVGDWVIVDENPMARFSSIKEILIRKNEISRMSHNSISTLVSNVDYGIICASLNQNFNLKRIERYISLLKSSEVRAVLVLTKLDLYEGEEAIENFVEKLSSSLNVEEILPISIEKKLNLESIEKLLCGNGTYTLLGSSGVGKSTLTNYLLGEDIQKVQEIREDGKGLHTTVSRSLHTFDGGVIIDTPGMRGMMLCASVEDINESYDDIKVLTMSCRFSNCGHTNEPGCELNKALESGELDWSRYENYLKLLREAAYFERKTSSAAYLAAKKEWKKVSCNARKKIY